MIARKKRLLIWVCEDGEGLWDCQREALQGFLPGCFVKHFRNVGYAARATGSPDFIIVDVGGAMGLGCDVVALTRANLGGLSELHPGAIFIIFSALGCYAEDVYEALKPELQACCEWMAGCCFYDLIEECIKKWL